MTNLVFKGTALVAILLFAACQESRDVYWRDHPSEAFLEITNRSLPPGVRAVAIRTEVTDNLLHASYVWLLEGLPSDLRKVVDDTEFVRSDDDARGLIPSATDLFGIRGAEAE